MLDQAQHTHMYITHYPNEDPSVSGELPECCDIYSIRVYAAIFSVTDAFADLNAHEL